MSAIQTKNRSLKRVIDPIIGLGILLVSLSAAPAAAPTTRPAVEQRGISVYFSPSGDCTWAIVDRINRATKTINVQAYVLTSPSIAQALAQAHDRGVKIRVVLDKMQATTKYSSATYLFNHQIPVWIDRKHSIAHNKIIIIDGATVITGSFNFTEAAETSNAENLLILSGKPEIAKSYENNFEDHLAHSQPYLGLGKSTTKPATR